MIGHCISHKFSWIGNPWNREEKMKKGLLVLACLAMMVTPLFAQGSKESVSTESSGPVELTYWVPLNPNIAQVVQEMGQTENSKEWERLTNTKIKFQHVAAGNDSQLSEGFNILVASGSYPDIIEYKWIDYPGGPISAINDGVIIPLNDVFKKYCPNISAFLKDHPDIAKMISTDDGTYYCFPFLRGTSMENNKLLFSEGWVLRKDLLDKLGLGIPETPDEWYTVLKGFKDMGIKTPLVLRKDHVSRALSTGFDSWDDFYVEDGKVRFGLIEPERKNYLGTVSKWYKEGLLDNDYFAVDKKVQATKVLNNECGATWAPGGSGIGTWLPAMRKSNPQVELVSASQMTSKKGQYAKFARMNQVYSNSGYSGAISTSCKNVEAAAKLLDFNYSEKGHNLANFGIEGVSFNMVNGYPAYTDVIMNNKDGLSKTQAMSMYIRGHIHGPFVQDQRELEQYYDLPELTEALELWTHNDMGKHIYPPASTTQEESEQLAIIINNVNTYRDEMEAKFITGALSINDFDKYVAQLKKFGIEKAIEIKQAAYDRYMAK